VPSVDKVRDEVSSDAAARLRAPAVLVRAGSASSATVLEVSVNSANSSAYLISKCELSTEVIVSVDASSSKREALISPAVMVRAG